VQLWPDIYMQSFRRLLVQRGGSGGVRRGRGGQFTLAGRVLPLSGASWFHPDLSSRYDIQHTTGQLFVAFVEFVDL
jgi:hypothetical protein